MGVLVSKALGIGTSKFPPPLNEPVGYVKYRFPNSVYSHVYYPIDEDGKKLGEKSKYMRTEAYKGMADFAGTRAFLFSNLTNVKHPYVLNAPLSSKMEGAVPTIIFSHGLGGLCENYSKVCSDLASHGYIVISVEHEDGSASYANSETKGPIRYNGPPKEMEYTRDNVINFRAPFLDQRLKEVKTVISVLKEHQNKRSDIETEPAQGNGKNSARSHEILSRCNLDKLFLAGHSFGSCSIVNSTCADQEVRDAIKACVLLDIWPMPLKREHVRQGLTKPTLSVLTEEFVKNKEVALTQKLLKNTAHPHVHSFYIPKTTHQQYSDTPFFLPGYLAKRAGAVGELAKEESQKTLIRTIVHFISKHEEDNDEKQVNWEEIMEETTLTSFL